MSLVDLYYNPYLSQMRVEIDGRPAPQYSNLYSLQGKPFPVWSENVLPLIQRAINDTYRLRFYSRAIECEMMGVVAQANKRYCSDYVSGPPELNMPIAQRLEQLDTTARRLGKKGVMSKAYAELYCSPQLSGSGLFEKQTYERQLQKGETYAFDIPTGYSHFGSCHMDATMQCFEPGLIQPSGNTCAILLARDEQDAEQMLKNVRVQEPIFVFLYSAGADGLLMQKGGVYLYRVTPATLYKRIVEAVEFKVLTPYLVQQNEKLLTLLTQRGTDEARMQADELRQAMGVEAFYSVGTIRAMTGGQMLPLQVRRVPAGKQPLSVRVQCEPRALRFANGSLIADDVEKPVNAHIEVYVSGVADPVSKQHFFIYPDETPVELTIRNPRATLYVGNRMQLTLEVAHEKKFTPKTIEWRSSDTRVATVDSDGRVTALSCGSCVLTACRGEELNASTSIRVLQTLDRIELSNRMMRATLSSSTATRMPLLVYAEPGQYDTTQVICTSSQPALATFQPRTLSPTERPPQLANKLILTEGYVICQAPGQATLEFVSASGSKACSSCVVSVTNAAPIEPPRKPLRIPWNAIAAVLVVLTVLLLRKSFWPLLTAGAGAVCTAIAFFREDYHNIWSWLMVSLALIALGMALLY